MTYIKKLSIQGFKSFAKKTDIYFDKGINTIVGPNGSGKSNISDGLCFVLGRLSIKSIRAAKAKNLIFMGSKEIKPHKEASVEIVFDNSDKTFNLPNEEISISRIVRDNGQSIYKINGETKTRADVIEMLAHAGIDPHGYNIILQGQIQSIVRMHPEERRKILEEVSGISIYETRKERSIKELEKTEQRLKEISTVLRERTSFLNNLERERAQALKFKDLEKKIHHYRYSILQKKINEKQKEINNIKESINEKQSLKEKTKLKIENIQKNIDSINEQISRINQHIKHSTGMERESLQEKISDLRAEIEGYKVRKENSENRKLEIEKRIEQMKSSIPQYKSEISELRKKSPLMAKKQSELKKKKEELAELEEQKNKIYSSKSELNSLKDRIKNEESRLTKLNVESDSLVKQIEELLKELKSESEEHCIRQSSKINKEIINIQKELEKISEIILHHNKEISSAETHIQNSETTLKKISEIDTCPLCKNKMTSEHISHVNNESKNIISESMDKIKVSKEELEKHKNNKIGLEEKLSRLKEDIRNLDREILSHKMSIEKQNYVKKIVDEINLLQTNLNDLKKKRELLENKSINHSIILEQYNAKLHEIEEISSRTEEDLDTTLLWKERELEKINQAIVQNKKDLLEIEENYSELSNLLDEKSDLLEKKENEESELSNKFKKLFDERDSLQSKIQDESYNLSGFQNESLQIEDQINYLKIGNAKIEAEHDSLKFELKDIPNIGNLEPIKSSIEVLSEKMEKAKQNLQSIGAINMRALEVYDGVKEEYDKVYEKVKILENEKLEILKIIEEIDNKKKRTFMKTFKGVNELFTRNFFQLSAKGQASLEVQNPHDLFAGGIDITIKLGKGKYFDVSSLSGGEQTLIALSLLFAIQEHKPYHFYIFDEIDAALDKRNSERLSALLNKYMQNGQYIVVTHNDALITNANFLYGVSMHEGVSKVLGLKLD